MNTRNVVDTIRIHAGNAVETAADVEMLKREAENERNRRKYSQGINPGAG
jgi:hypothetical protein